MREFGKTPRKSWLQKLMAFLEIFVSGGNNHFGGHNDRMQSRRRKTKFDR